MLLDYDLNCFLEAPPIYSQWLLLLPSGHFFLTHYRMKLGPIWRGHWRLCLHLWLACLPIIEISNPRSSLISQMVTISLNSCWQLFWQWGSLNNLIFHLFDYNHCYMQTGTLTALSKAAPPLFVSVLTCSYFKFTRLLWEDTLWSVFCGTFCSTAIICWELPESVQVF